MSRTGAEDVIDEAYRRLIIVGSAESPKDYPFLFGISDVNRAGAHVMFIGRAMAHALIQHGLALWSGDGCLRPTRCLAQ